MKTKYFDINEHIIDNEFITRGDKSKPRLDLSFEIYGKLIVVKGKVDCILEWNSRFNFNEYTEEQAISIKNQYIKDSNDSNI